MPKSIAPIVRELSNRTSMSLTRTSLFNFIALLALVFAAATYSLVYLAHELDHSEQDQSAFYTRKAVQSLEKSLRVTVKEPSAGGVVPGFPCSQSLRSGALRRTRLARTITKDRPSVIL